MSGLSVCLVLGHSVLPRHRVALQRDGTQALPTGINVETIVVSVIGAIIVIFAANLLLGRDRSHGTV